MSPARDKDLGALEAMVGYLVDVVVARIVVEEEEEGGCSDAAGPSAGAIEAEGQEHPAGVTP